MKSITMFLNKYGMPIVACSLVGIAITLILSTFVFRVEVNASYSPETGVNGEVLYSAGNEVTSDTTPENSSDMTDWLIPGTGIIFFPSDMQSQTDDGTYQSVSFYIGENDWVAVRADQTLGEGAVFMKAFSFTHKDDYESYLAILAEVNGEQVVVILDEFGAFFDEAKISPEYNQITSIDSFFVQNYDRWGFNFVTKDGTSQFERISGSETQIR